MNLIKSLVEDSIEILRNTDQYSKIVSSYNEENEIYSIKLFVDDDISEILSIYKDYFESEFLGNKEILVCEVFLTKNLESINLPEILQSNEDLFFSKIYLSEEDENILIENCSFLENMLAKNLATIIDEMIQHSMYLKEEIINN